MRADQVDSIINKAAPNGCWVATKYINGRGYCRPHIDGKSWNLHRWMYQREVGLIPADKIVCHSCDNRACCNPTHLWLGTVRDNNLDAINKGRPWTPIVTGWKGEKHPCAKLTDAQRDEIRAKRAAGATRRSLCKEYGISNGTIHYVLYPEQQQIRGAKRNAERRERTRLKLQSL